MAEQVTITNLDNSDARVAYDLMQHIANAEYHKPIGDPETREYWIRLYLQSRAAVRSASLDNILKI